MQTATRVITLTTILALCAATVATAQRPQTRKGFWIAFGLGWGSADLTCDGCTGSREGGGVAHVRLGGTLNQKLLLGGDITAWGKEEGGSTASMGNVSFIAQYYPMEQGGLFLKGGAGFSSLMIESGGNTASGESFGLSAGVGYDIRVGRNISITPIADFLFGGSRDLQYAGTTVASGIGMNVFTVGLGVTFH
jgi:outer membrane protein with beta-barrel domain